MQTKPQTSLDLVGVLNIPQLFHTRLFGSRNWNRFGGLVELFTPTISGRPMVHAMVDVPRALLASGLLCCSCAIMVVAWYLHLKFANWSAGKAILFSWVVAGGEYCLQVPANRIGSQAGMSAAQLRAVAEIAILLSFIIFQTRVLSQPLLWNHLVGFLTVFVGVLLVLGGPFTSPVSGGTALINTSQVETLELVPEHSLPASPPASLLEASWSSSASPRAASPPSPFSFSSMRAASPPSPFSFSSMPASPCPILVPPQSPSPSPPLSSPPPSAAHAASSLLATSALPAVAPDAAAAPPSLPPEAASRFAERMALLADHSTPGRLQALRELKAGKKRGHWIWWSFPTLGSRGGDMNSFWTGADLRSTAEAAAYASHPELRAGLLQVLRTAAAAFARHSDGLGPYHVLDEGFGRRPQGIWIGGPVDAFKAWCSCTLFAGLAARTADEELHNAAQAVLAQFAGGRMVYTAGGEGTAGYVADEARRRNVLESAGDSITQRLLSLS